MRQNIPRDARQQQSPQAAFLRMMRRDRRVQRETASVRPKTEPSPQAAAHGGAVANCTPTIMAQRLAIAPLRQHGEPACVSSARRGTIAPMRYPVSVSSRSGPARPHRSIAVPTLLCCILKPEDTAQHYRCFF